MSEHINLSVPRCKSKSCKIAQNITKSNKLKFTVMLHRKATQSMIKVSWLIELEKKMIIRQKGIIFLSFLKVNILLGHHNCLSVQCIDGACWISLGVLSPVESYSCCPTSHRTRRYLCSFPITWTPPPPPPSRERDIPPIWELVKALAITKTPLFLALSLNLFRDDGQKYPRFPRKWESAFGPLMH